MKMADSWVVVPMAMIALMMEAESTSETSVTFYQTTRRYNPEYSHLNKWLIHLYYFSKIGNKLVRS
jgi:hypothetical protein